MLDNLKFVKGAVATKDFVPELTHFHIGGGFVKGFNGSLALCAPIDLDLEASPKATPFIKAITTCKSTIAMHLTPTGKLSIKSGKFKAFVECVEQKYPDIEPEGELVDLPDDFISTISKLAAFIAEDDSKPWARGVLIDGNFATATNNIIIAQAWMPTAFPYKINIPQKAVREMVRLKENPISAQVSATTVTFHYADGRWLRTNLLELKWPDINRVLDAPATPVTLPNGFFECIEALVPFSDECKRIYFGETEMKTHMFDSKGAVQEIEGLTEGPIMNGEQLLKLRNVVQTIDFSMYPRPCVFFGDGVRGAVVGVRG
jgi:DNA polymerase III sliding clamp (beta) subunit (PCNA family)